MRHKAIAQLRAGARNADIARAPGVPLGTVGYWRHLERAERGECPGAHHPTCPRCDGRDLDAAAYAYLLALCLGDGHVIQYSTHVWRVFPQHGEGEKRKRPVVLEPRQQEIVDAHPWEFIRGPIHSDGCRSPTGRRAWSAVSASATHTRGTSSATSPTIIRRLCSDTLTKVGVEWTTLARGSDPFNTSVARKASVALMDTHIGPKF